MKFFLILPERCARISCPSPICTLNVALGRDSMTVPSTGIISSLGITAPPSLLLTEADYARNADACRSLDVPVRITHHQNSVYHLMQQIKLRSKKPLLKAETPNRKKNSAPKLDNMIL